MSIFQNGLTCSDTIENPPIIRGVRKPGSAHESATTHHVCHVLFVGLAGGAKAFHDSMRFYSRQAPDAVKRVLTQKAGLTPEQADAVLQAGPGYLQEMKRADAAAHAEVQQRYRSLDLPAPSAAVIPRPAFRKGAVPPARAPIEWSGNLPQMMERDGVIARVNRRKADALAAHRGALSAILGADGLAAFENWLKTTVAPSEGCQGGHLARTLNEAEGELMDTQTSSIKAIWRRPSGQDAGCTQCRRPW
jgi:hypothetical protein